MAKYFIRLKGDQRYLHAKVGDVVVGFGSSFTEDGWQGLKDHCMGRVRDLRGEQLRLFKTAQVNAKQGVPDERG
jgi:hypothetical protein